MSLWLCPIVAFLIGSIPFGVLIARTKGIDIRSHGSGNIGATNVFRIVGKRFGILCFILDALKGFIPTLLGVSLIRYVGQDELMIIRPLVSYAYLFPSSSQAIAQSLQVVVGLCSILGHNYSPWVGFRGGKGIATSAGVLIALMPAAVMILVLVWIVVFALTRYVSIASVITAASLPVLTLWGSWYHGKIADQTWNRPLFVFSVIIALLAVWKHRTNLKRLRDGTEHRFQRKSSGSTSS